MVLGKSGNATIKGRTFDVQADPSDVFGALKFAVIGDLEARKGPFSLMVDGFYGLLKLTFLAHGGGGVAATIVPDSTPRFGPLSQFGSAQRVLALKA